jgi:preprotein translocase subunit SecA
MGIRRKPQGLNPTANQQVGKGPTVGLPVEKGTGGVEEAAGAKKPTEVKSAKEALRAQAATPELSAHVQAEAPSAAMQPGASASVFDLRLGKAQVKRLWNKMQAMAGVGDPGSIRRADEIVGQTRELEAKLSGLSDGELRGQLVELKAGVKAKTADKRAEIGEARKELASAKSHADDDKIGKAKAKVDGLVRELNKLEFEEMDKIMPQVFALTSETSARQLGKRPYDVQLMSGTLLQRGKVVEQYTGEGKTISALAPTVLAAQNGRGVHVATSSNYLAKRDAIEMAPVYNALGLSVAALTPEGKAVRIDPPDGEVRECDRREAYLADVTYATATQFGFDYLRDNLTKDPSQKVQRTHASLIMDEVDSLIIDDARTPLIISGQPGEAHGDVRGIVSDAVEKLELGKDLEFDRSENWASLSDEGFDRLAELLGLDDPMKLQDPDLGRFVDAAIRARCLFTKGVDYIVKDEKVDLIGRNGEVLPGRRLSAGLHQAIEAREGVEVQPESHTIGSITLRDYLGKYDRVGGMTGTAESSESIFEGVYNLDVVRVPTHRPLLRKDLPTRMFATIEDKAMAIMADAQEVAASGRPVLLGVPDEQTAEALSMLFAENGIDHACLTATNDEAEAQVIANAGRAGAITIATPKGGRGVHFELGGKGRTDAEHQAVIDAGGLMVLGFSHTSSERIDDQLRGRAARQGQPGSTRFYASAEDRFFMQREMPKWVSERPPGPEGLESREVSALVKEHSNLSESLLEAQLKDSLPYDNVIGAHRERYLDQRDQVMEGRLVEGTVGIVEDALTDRLEGWLETKDPKKPEDLFQLYVDLAHVLPLPQRSEAPASWQGLSQKELKAKILEDVCGAVNGHLEAIGEPADASLRLLLLQGLDDGWSGHLEELDAIRAGIGWQAIAEKDPKQQFVMFANDAWGGYMRGTRDAVMGAVFRSMQPLAFD